MEMINWKQELIAYNQATDELYVKFQNIKKSFVDLDEHSPIEDISIRVKSIDSILDKATKRDIPMSKIFKFVEDIAGVRITCKFVEDIYRVVQIIRERDGKDLSVVEEEDYIKNTKQSGYRSYHITILYPVVTARGLEEVPCEIQIRTMAMNFWATIEHSLRYKYSGNMPDNIKEKLQNCAEASFILDTEMSTIRTEIIQAERVIQTKEHLVAEILKYVQNLYCIGKFEEANDINKKFIEIYEDTDIEKLKTFRDNVRVVAELYKVSNI